MEKPPFRSRELSWLDFNERVLARAARPELPILERLRFLAISASNLDEFFMVRVAYLHDKCKGKSSKKPGKPDDAGYTPRRQLEEVLERTLVFQTRQVELYGQLQEELQQMHIPLEPVQRLDNEQRAEAEKLYYNEILPVLTPFAVDPGRPFPFLSNKALYIGVRLQDKKGEEQFGLVQVPANLPRYLPAQGGKETVFTPLEELIAAHLDTLFGLHRMKAWGFFRVTRSADFDADEDTDDLLEEMKRTVKKRKRGKPIRLELSQREGAPFDRKLQRFLVEMLRIPKRYVVTVPGPLDLGALEKVALYPQLEYLQAPLPEPAQAADFQDTNGQEGIFEGIRRRDRMLHLPYEAFAPVVDFIEAAACDPQVLAIKQTLYRVSGNGGVTVALEKAAERGKQVTVLLELRARFDEERNMRWAERLEKAGCNVIYGLTGLKTHCKITLVVRQEEGGINRYVHLGTGNYNDTTARSYTDLGLFTCDSAIGADASDLFNHLTGFTQPPAYRKLVAAPEQMRSFFLNRIQREIDNARQGTESAISIKVNSLLDGEVVRKLYEASQAGVPVRLFVRGICSLVPGVEGYSENIQVRSLVGRYLEHSRIFRFENGGKPLVYLGSADLMPRNLDRRVEILFPVEAPALNKRVSGLLELLWKDNVDACEQGGDGVYRPVARRGKKVSAQQELSRLAQGGWQMPRPRKQTRGSGTGAEKQKKRRKIMRIGLLTSGGDCQGLNAALRAVARTLYESGKKVELYGIHDGYKGLIEGQWHKMKPEEFSGILRRGGTILGTSRQPFKQMQSPDGDAGADRLTRMVENYRRGGFEALVVLGGNGTQKSAHLLSASGANVVSLPKTIDNDIFGTDATFGFDSAVEKATSVIDAIHTTAASHGRVFVVELMGHKVGWVALYAGIAGGADVILLPELPYEMDSVESAIEKRTRQGKSFSIVAVAEGAVSLQEAQLPKKERKALLEGPHSAGMRVARALTARLGQEVRATVPGHFQRGGEPTPADRLLCSRLGAVAGRLILEGSYGVMVASRGEKIVAVPLEETAGKLKTIPRDCEILSQARLMGISFGEKPGAM